MEQVNDFLKGLTFKGKYITLLLHLFNLRDSLFIDKELLLEFSSCLKSSHYYAVECCFLPQQKQVVSKKNYLRERNR